MARLHFNAQYREPIELSDGTAAVLRLVQPTDQDLLRRGLQEMSPESRYRRFFTPKARLSDKEVKCLTNLDGEDHLAIGAVCADDGCEEGMGVARFVRLNDDRAVAEPAVAVVDAYHRRGLGTQLLQRLAAAAWEREVRWFRFEFLEENEPVRHMVESLAGQAVRIERHTDGVLAAMIPVPEIKPGDLSSDVLRGSASHKLLSHAARGELSARLRLGRLVLKG